MKFTGSTNDPGANVTYEWNFGDGTKKIGKTVNHTYFDSGNFTLELKVIDILGEEAYVQKVISIKGPKLYKRKISDLVTADLLRRCGSNAKCKLEVNASIVHLNRSVMTQVCG